MVRNIFKKKGKGAESSKKKDEKMDKLLRLRKKINNEAERITSKIDRERVSMNSINFEKLEKLSKKYEKLEKEIERTKKQS